MERITTRSYEFLATIKSDITLLENEHPVPSVLTKISARRHKVQHQQRLRAHRAPSAPLSTLSSSPTAGFSPLFWVLVCRYVSQSPCGYRSATTTHEVEPPSCTSSSKFSVFNKTVRQNNALCYVECYLANFLPASSMKTTHFCGGGDKRASRLFTNNHFCSVFLRIALIITDEKPEDFNTLSLHHPGLLCF